MEYANDKFIVCLLKDEQFYIIDRAKKQITHKVRWNTQISAPRSYNFEIIKMPGFDVAKFPFLLMRDDYIIYVFNLITRRLYNVKSAFFGSDKSYKTLDLITQPGAAQEFDAVFLETGEAENPHNATTTINRISFTQIFMNTLKQIASSSH